MDGEPDPAMSLAASAAALPPLEEAMWEMSLGGSGSMEMGPFPERPGEPDCTYYVRTGMCKYGITCRYNHPPDRKLAISAARAKGGYPERPGQPECQYYLKTGTCKFGATCKFHHPKDNVGTDGGVQLNILGYPLRPNEKECAYYLRTGQCKFGSTCKYHHPQQSNSMVSLHGSPVYTPVHSPTTPGQQSYNGGLTNWPLSRAFVPNPRWQGSSSYAHVILPQGLVQVPSWNPYSGHLGSGSSQENQQQTTGTAQLYGTLSQTEATAARPQGTFSSYQPGSFPMGMYAVQTENIFPERPDQPECQFYMKTGDCKFGSVCKFHHPRDRFVPIPNCMLSPLGLPLRPGEPLCIFYSRYGICKFGPNCKFDHPMGNLTYGISPSSTSDIPAARRLHGSSSSSGTPTLLLSSEGTVRIGPSSSRRPIIESGQSSAEEHIEAEGSHTTSSIVQVSSFS